MLSCVFLEWMLLPRSGKAVYRFPGPIVSIWPRHIRRYCEERHKFWAKLFFVSSAGTELFGNPVLRQEHLHCRLDDRASFCFCRRGLRDDHLRPESESLEQGGELIGGKGRVVNHESAVIGGGLNPSVKGNFSLGELGPLLLHSGDGDRGCGRHATHCLRGVATSWLESLARIHR